MFRYSSEYRFRSILGKKDITTINNRINTNFVENKETVEFINGG